MERHQHNFLTEAAILFGVAAVLMEEPSTPRRIEEDKVEKAEVERAVRSYLKKELPSSVMAQLKKAAKDEEFEAIVSAVTGKVLARFFEIMWTRKTTWQSQLKAK